MSIIQSLPSEVDEPSMLSERQGISSKSVSESRWIVNPFEHLYAEADPGYPDIALKQNDFSAYENRLEVFIARRGDGLSGSALLEYWRRIAHLDERLIVPVWLDLSEMFFDRYQTGEDTSVSWFINAAVVKSLFAHVWWRYGVTDEADSVQKRLARVFDTYLDATEWRALVLSAIEPRERRARGMARALDTSLRRQALAYYAKTPSNDDDNGDLLTSTTCRFLEMTARQDNSSDKGAVHDHSDPIRANLQSLDLLGIFGVKKILLIVDGLDAALAKGAFDVHRFLEKLISIVKDNPQLMSHMFVSYEAQQKIRDAISEVPISLLNVTPTQIEYLISLRLLVVGISRPWKAMLDAPERLRIQAAIESGATLRDIFTILKAIDFSTAEYSSESHRRSSFVPSRQDSSVVDDLRDVDALTASSSHTLETTPLAAKNPLFARR